MFLVLYSTLLYYPFHSKLEAILSSERMNILVSSGNELSGHGTGARVDAKLYGKDVTELRSILQQLYRAPLSQPLLLAPGGFFDQQWYTLLLQTSGHGVVSALTHHIYNLGGGM
jgi:hypothetical protein